MEKFWNSTAAIFALVAIILSLTSIVLAASRVMAQEPPAVIQTETVVTSGHIDLLGSRVLTLYGTVTMDQANVIVNDLRVLDQESGTKEIVLRIISPGGDVLAGLMIIDAMRQVRAPVRTICEGMCASMGAVILFAGEPGLRTSMPSATIMIHSLSQGASGTLDQLEQQMAEGIRVQGILNDIVVKNSNLTLDQVKEMMKTDYFMSPDKALEFGLIDNVL